MKQYKENCFGIEYHVLEYDANDLFNYVPKTNVINEIIKCTSDYQYLKVVSKVSGEQIDYYKDGMKHNENGPSTIYENKPKSYHVEDKKLPENVFTGWKRTSLIDRMLDENI
jgi:hypothetical protein